MWKEVKLGAVCRFIGGSQPAKSNFEYVKSNKNIRLIQIRDYKSDKHIVYIPKEKAKRFCKRSDVMIGRYGPPIFQILRGIEGAYNVALMKAIPKEGLDNDYLFYFLQNKKLLNYVIVNSIRAAGQSGVKKEALEEYDLVLPSLEEQKIIVAKIDSAFAEIDKLLSINQNNLENTKRIYSNGIDETFKMLSSNYEELGKYSKINYGYTTKASFSKGKYKLLRITDLQDNSVNWDAVPYCEIEKEKLDKMLLYDGDIVFARTGATTGKSFLVEKPVNALFASYLIRVSVDREVFEPSYVMHFFQSTNYWQQVKEGISGSAQGGFNASKLSRLKIPKINKTQQQKIVEKLDLLHEKTNRLARFYEDKLDQYISLKFSFLSKELKT